MAFRLRLPLLLVVLVFAGLSACNPGEQEPIILGFVGVLSGPIALNGELNSRGAMLAVEEINAGGGVSVGGTKRPLKLVLEDDQGGPTSGVNAVNKLVEQDKAFAILGPELSSVVIPTLELTRRHKVVQFHSTNSLATGKEGVHSPYAFRNRVEDTYLARAVVDYIANELGGKDRRVGISLLNNEYGRTGSSLVEQGLKEKGISVTAKVSHNFRDQDLTPSAAAILSDGADTVVTWSGPSESILLQRTLKNLGWKGTFIHGNPDLIYVSLGKEEVEGVVGPQGWAPAETREKSRKFVAAYRKRFNQVPDNHSAAYYDTVYLLRSAIEAVGLDADKVRDYVTTIKKWEGVQGNFHPADLTGGNLITDVVLVKIQNGELRILRK